jgi:hypothetical protein
MMDNNFYQPGGVTRVPLAKREVQFIGNLPRGGAWVMHAVPTSGAKWAIVITDTFGKYEARVVKDGVMTVLKPSAAILAAPPQTDPGAGHTAEERT